VVVAVALELHRDPGFGPGQVHAALAQLELAHWAGQPLGDEQPGRLQLSPAPCRALLGPVFEEGSERGHAGAPLPADGGELAGQVRDRREPFPQGGVERRFQLVRAHDRRQVYDRPSRGRGGDAVNVGAVRDPAVVHGGPSEVAPVRRAL
jgi:hypothetical protein